MKYAPTLWLCLLLLSACQHQRLGLLNQNNLPTYSTTIDPSKPNYIGTPHGATIRIPDHAFKVPAGTKVTIAIKEAYSAKDILLAGLTTESGGRNLSSGGMIWFSATADGKAVEYAKPVKIDIPTATYDNRMQLFKGEQNADSSVGWKAPVALDSTPYTQYLAAGKALFNANCANCHKVADDYVGPPMAGSRQRSPNPAWAYKFINNSNSMYETDPYAKYLLARYGSRMTQFNLTKYDIKAILDYADNEARLLPQKWAALQTNDYNKILLDSSAKNPSSNPCFDTSYLPDPDTLNLTDVSDSVNNLPESFMNPSLGNLDEPEYNGYQSVLPQKGTYSFSINQNGWYNVDKFSDDDLNVSDVSLEAKLVMADPFDMTVYLCLPGQKILMTSEFKKDDRYVFKGTSNTIRLPKGEKAFIFAIGTQKDECWYGIQEFTVQDQQTIEVKVKKTTPDAIKAAIKNNSLDEIKIDTSVNQIKITPIPCDQPRPDIFPTLPSAGLTPDGNGASTDFP